MLVQLAARPQTAGWCIHVVSPVLPLAQQQQNDGATSEGDSMYQWRDRVVAVDGRSQADLQVL